MSGISSGTGLVSGLPTSQIIDSLIQAASGPKTLLSKRLTTIQAQRTSLTELNARLLALKTSVTRLKDASFFNHYSATSSNESALTASASNTATAGTISMTVRGLVTSHQLVSNGFATGDTTPVGAGRITIEQGNGMVERRTALGDLNGGQGVRRGKIHITDRAGHVADVDLSSAVDVRDVLDAINNAADVQVHARADGGHIVLDDRSDGTGTLTVSEVRGGFTAADLGLRQSVTTASLVGSDVLYLTDGTDLTRLNDGNGVRHTIGLDDFRVTNTAGVAFNVRLDGTVADTTRLEVLNGGNGVRLGTIRISNRLGQSGTVDLSAAQTLGDVRTAIAAAVDERGASLNVTAALRTVGGVGSLMVTDGNVIPKPTEEESEEAVAAKPKLTIEDLGGYAARDLGIAQTASAEAISGTGVHRVATIGDAIRAINYADGNNGSVAASLTPNGLHLEDKAAGAGSLIVEGLTNGHTGVSKAAQDLGIEGPHGSDFETRDLLAGLNTVLLQSLNGGNGLALGKVSFTTKAGGTPVTVDFTDAQTLQDIVTKINTQVPGVTAEINAVGHGLALTDTSGGSGALTVSDVEGNLAAIGPGASAKGTLSGQNLQVQYYNERTELSGLNGGRGVRQGSMEVRTSTGTIFAVEIDSGDKTLGDAINAINDVGVKFGVHAEINATGDGIALTDTNGGTERLRVRDREDGTAATDLRLKGEAPVGSNTIDGTFEIHIDVQAGDSLQTIATKIRDASPDIYASVINDGASAAPYRLSVTSGQSGRRGQLVFDTGATSLGMSTLVAARDAVVLVGGQDSSSPIVITSGSNTLHDILPGVTMTLHDVSDEPITVSTARDIEQVSKDLQSFVDGYNAVIDRIDSATAYDQETQTKGPLLGDATISTLENRLSRGLLQRASAAPVGFQTLSTVGITVGDQGRLDFDEEVFNDRFAADPTAVRSLFSGGKSSIGATLDQVLTDLTEDSTGLITSREKVLGEQVDDINERIADMDVRLARKREQLERQYANLETVLSGMQSQQSALSQLASLIATSS